MPESLPPGPQVDGQTSMAPTSIGEPSRADPRVARRSGRWTETLVDLAVAVFSTAAAVVLHLETVEVRGGSGITGSVALAALHGAVVFFRRHRSWAVLMIQIGTAALYVLSGFPAFMLGPAVLFAVYSAGAELG